MRQLIALSRVQMQGMLHSLRLTSRAGRLGYALALTCLIGLAITYLGTLGFQLAGMGLAGAIPSLAVLMGSLSGVAFTFMKANGALFGAADYESVMALPVPARVLVLSRMGAMLAYAVALAALCMAPLYAGYFSAVPATPAAIAIALASIVLAPLAPTCLAAFAAFAVAAAASRFRHAGLASIALTLAVVAAIIVASFGKSLVLQQQGVDAAALMLMMADLAGYVRHAVEAVYPPAAWLAAGLTEGSPAGLAGFALWSVAVPALAIELMARWYMGIDGALAVHAAASRMDEGELARSAPPLAALVVKELRTLASIPVYAMNSLAGPLLMLVAAGALCIFGLEGAVAALAAGDKDLAFLLSAEIAPFVELLLPWAFAFCASICTPATVGTSLEGRSAWVMATLPLTTGTILMGKLGASLLLVAAPTAAAAVALTVCGQLGALAAIETALVPLAVLALVGNIGMAADVAHPNYGWTAPVEVVKRGAPVMVSLLATLVVAFGGGALTLAVALNAGPLAAHAFIFTACALCIAAGALIFRRTSRTPLWT